MNTQTQLILNIGGMACSGCANTVQNALSDLDGVQKASVNLDDETASVSHEATVASVDDSKRQLTEPATSFWEWKIRNAELRINLDLTLDKPFPDIQHPQRTCVITSA